MRLLTRTITHWIDSRTLPTLAIKGEPATSRMHHHSLARGSIMTSWRLDIQMETLRFPTLRTTITRVMRQAAATLIRAREGPSMFLLHPPQPTILQTSLGPMPRRHHQTWLPLEHTLQHFLLLFRPHRLTSITKERCLIMRRIQHQALLHSAPTQTAQPGPVCTEHPTRPWSSINNISAHSTLLRRPTTRIRRVHGEVPTLLPRHSSSSATPWAGHPNNTVLRQATFPHPQTKLTKIIICGCLDGGAHVKKS